ncbi:uncharacterized protein EI97DRAFT_435694 [Westerdykella ornata]|uniref:Helicase SWR1 n=1 Tax=Westerdykella ornata TaxID=318751 RepID=A0A6A6JC31_WESOR|nr:uncharacterized protein EI97DRAFT_435694 [Westerdykella ornata]KAF2273774.1 hypothetical protein EI97DRAFT_435694 [Westerdykella ornata]
MPRGRPRRSLRGDMSNQNVTSGASPAQASSKSAKAAKASGETQPNHRRTRSSRLAVANSSDNEGSLLEGEVASPPPTTHKVLKAVSIVTRTTNKASANMAARVATGAQKGGGSSLGTPSIADSEYETPLTSFSTTPAGSVGPGARSSRKSKLVSIAVASSSRKRKTAVVADSGDVGEDIDEDLSPDALLARQLQKEEEEYAKLANKRRKTELLDAVEDSEDDMSEILEEEDEPLPMYTGKGKGKAVELPARRTRSTMRATMDFVALSDEDLDIHLDNDAIIDLVSDSEEESLMMASKKRKTTNSSPAKSAKGKGKTIARQTPAERAREKRRRLAEARERNARFAHIEDKWDRKRAMNRERAEQNHPKLLTMWDDLAQIPVLDTQRAEQPPSINRRLKPFQLEGLSWMTRQEKTGYKGGLLGDEMGMGKTIQAVSLIMSDYPAKDPTLVVVPPVALMQWSNEIREYTDGKLNVLVYHGTNSKCKNMTIKELKKFDVIMVSYNSLESLHRKETKGWTRGDNIIKEASPLHPIHYHRLILDEAHSIKSRTTGVAKACFALKGTYKWCLSGTPVQNRIGEFFSLLRFLEVRPFADYFCRSCPCEQLHWQIDEDHMCTACNHGGSEHISVFNQELLNPITGDNPDLREEALEKLHMITARIMLRRMKRDHTNSMELPMKDIIIHNEFFSDVERDFSTSIMTNSSRKFDTYVAQGVMLNNYANIFGLIMQMRQVANHPDLLLKKNAAEGQNVFVCNICDEPAEDAIRSRCHHEFCRACVKDYIDTCEASGTDADCPRCHIALSIDFEQPELEQDEEGVKKSSIINRIKMENWTSSTKIEMLVYDLYKLRSKKQTLKSIVFSQFTSMLQLIEWRLRRAGFNTVMLDGSMTPAMRQKSIEHFMTNPDVEVFLVSLKAGGVALNLTEASRVFIVDPWWNPAAEWQSADRCHRIGQKRPCVITRLCIEDSVESRMVALQEKKAAMIAGTVNNDKVAMDRLSPEDLQFLFRGT